MIEAAYLTLKWLVISIASLLLAGILWEHFSRWKLEKKALKGKTFVEINGKPVHYVKKGDGYCTVVFQSGMGSSYGIWQQIQDNISQNAVTLSYDRNGLMFSAPNGKPVTNRQVSDELQALLEKTKCPRPYILVGHSMAGIYLRPFIHDNPKDISGIIFADAAHPLQKQKASARLLQSFKIPPRWFIKLAVNTGIYRAVFSFLPLSPEIPLHHPIHQLEKNFFYRSYTKTLEELDSDDINFKDATQYKSFGAIPLTVITGTSELRFTKIKDTAVKNEYRQLITDLQYDLLNLSSNSRWVKAINSGHILQINDSSLLVNEISRMIKAAKHYMVKQ